MTTKKVLGLVLLLIGAATLGYLALFKVGSWVLGLGGAIASGAGYTMLFGFSTGRKAAVGDGK
jgi:hypothetical protein